MDPITVIDVRCNIIFLARDKTKATGKIAEPDSG